MTHTNSRRKIPPKRYRCSVYGHPIGQRLQRVGNVFCGAHASALNGEAFTLQTVMCDIAACVQSTGSASVGLKQNNQSGGGNCGTENEAGQRKILRRVWRDHQPKGRDLSKVWSATAGHRWRAIRHSRSSSLYVVRLHGADEDLAAQLQHTTTHCYSAVVPVGHPRLNLHCVGLGQVQVPQLWQGRREHASLTGRALLGMGCPTHSPLRQPPRAHEAHHG